MPPGLLLSSELRKPLSVGLGTSGVNTTVSFRSHGAGAASKGALCRATITAIANVVLMSRMLVPQAAPSEGLGPRKGVSGGLLQ